MEEENKNTSTEIKQGKINPKALISQFGDRKIEAIKYVREQTGLGLKEAKDIVDAAYAGDFHKDQSISQDQKTNLFYTKASETYTGRSASTKSRIGIVLLLTLILLILVACAYFLLL